MDGHRRRRGQRGAVGVEDATLPTFASHKKSHQKAALRSRQEQHETRRPPRRRSRYLGHQRSEGKIWFCFEFLTRNAGFLRRNLPKLVHILKLGQNVSQFWFFKVKILDFKL